MARRAKHIFCRAPIREKTKKGGFGKKKQVESIYKEAAAWYNKQKRINE